MTTSGIAVPDLPPALSPETVAAAVRAVRSRLDPDDATVVLEALGVTA